MIPALNQPAPSFSFLPLCRETRMIRAELLGAVSSRPAGLVYAFRSSCPLAFSMRLLAQRRLALWLFFLEKNVGITAGICVVTRAAPSSPPGSRRLGAAISSIGNAMFHSARHRY